MAFNKGRTVQFISGITGVIPGGQALVNLPATRRYHRIVFQCYANNYSGGTALPLVALSGAGTGGTFTPTVVNGTVTGGTATGATGYAINDTFTFTDSTGTGFVGTILTVTAGNPTTFTVTSGATPSAINPAKFFTSFVQKVNGIIIRDIDVADTLKLIQANNRQPRIGELPIYYTEPWRNIAYLPEGTSWDLIGQKSFEIQMGISNSMVNPGLIGVMEFDYSRNELPNAQNVMTPVLLPITHHSFSWSIVSGRNDITTIPFSFPVLRLWVRGSVPGAITQFEVLQDGDRPLETVALQNKQIYEEYGYQFGKPNWNNSSAAPATIQPQSYFDAAFISDPDYDFGKVMRVQNSMILRVTSSVAQTLTIVEECMPGSYS